SPGGSPPALTTRTSAPSSSPAAWSARRPAGRRSRPALSSSSSATSALASRSSSVRSRAWLGAVLLPFLLPRLAQAGTPSIDEAEALAKLGDLVGAEKIFRRILEASPLSEATQTTALSDLAEVLLREATTAPNPAAASLHRAEAEKTLESLLAL